MELLKNFPVSTCYSHQQPASCPLYTYYIPSLTSQNRLGQGEAISSVRPPFFGILRYQPVLFLPVSQAPHCRISFLLLCAFKGPQQPPFLFAAQSLFCHILHDLFLLQIDQWINFHFIWFLFRHWMPMKYIKLPYETFYNIIFFIVSQIKLTNNVSYV